MWDNTMARRKVIGCKISDELSKIEEGQNTVVRLLQLVVLSVKMSVVKPNIIVFQWIT